MGKSVCDTSGDLGQPTWIVMGLSALVPGHQGFPGLDSHGNTQSQGQILGQPCSLDRCPTAPLPPAHGHRGQRRVGGDSKPCPPALSAPWLPCLPLPSERQVLSMPAQVHPLLGQ